MPSVDFAELLNEYANKGIGDLMYSLIHSIVKNTCPLYPPNIYSPHGVWDEGTIDDLCQDFTLTKLIRPGNLEHHLYASENITHLARMIKRDLRHYLINHAQNTSYRRIRKRAQKVLETNQDFVSDLGENDERLWWLANSSSSESVQNLETLVHIMGGFPLPPAIRYSITSSKSSPIISNSDLERLLRSTFSQADKRIPFGLLMEALRNRLNLYEDETLSLNDPLSSSEQDDRTIADAVDDATPSIEAQAEASEISVKIFSQLTSRQKNVLNSYLGLLEPSQTMIAQQLGTSVGTVNQELRTIVECIRSICVNPDDADSVLQHLAILLDNEESSRE